MGKRNIKGADLVQKQVQNLRFLIRKNVEFYNFFY